jgi:DNA-binding NtrC family response regulator
MATMKSTPASTTSASKQAVPSIIIDSTKITWNSMNRQEVPTLAKVEEEHILQTLRIARGNRTHAAQILGISLRTLRNKIRQYRAEGTFVPSNRAGRVTKKELALLEGKAEA